MSQTLNSKRIGGDKPHKTRLVADQTPAVALHQQKILAAQNWNRFAFSSGFCHSCLTMPVISNHESLTSDVGQMRSRVSTSEDRLGIETNVALGEYRKGQARSKIELNSIHHSLSFNPIHLHFHTIRHRLILSILF